jgi:hypothetical protein
MNPITLFLVIACALVGLALGKTVDMFLAPPFLVAAVIIALSLKMANAWQKFVILRAGKLQRGVRCEPQFRPPELPIAPRKQAQAPSSTGGTEGSNLSGGRRLTPCDR